MERLGAKMITLKDMAGLVNPSRIFTLMPKLKQALNIPVDFHTHCTPGYGLGSVYAAIVAGVDIVDTNCWWFGGGTGAPAVELVYLFCKKLGIELGANMEAVAKINGELKDIRKELELSVFGAEKPLPKPFNPLTDEVPAEVDALLDRCVKAAQEENWDELLVASQAIEAYFGFPAPNKLVQDAEIPGGMYSNMVAQLKQLGAEDILPRAMELIPPVRLAAGLPPLVTPTSQIVGAQAVNCAMDEKAGRAMYTNKSAQFVGLVKGDYGRTPVKISEDFREKICGFREERPYDTSKYQKQPNPALEKAGGVTDYAYLKGARLVRRVNKEELARMKSALQSSITSTDSILVNTLDAKTTYYVAINLDKAIKNPGSVYDVVLREGDELILPVYPSTVRVDGSVLSPNEVTYEPGKSVSYYIEQAGGYSDNAKKRKKYMIAMNGHIYKAKGRTKVEPGAGQLNHKSLTGYEGLGS